MHTSIYIETYLYTCIGAFKHLFFKKEKKIFVVVGQGMNTGANTSNSWLHYIRLYFYVRENNNNNTKMNYRYISVVLFSWYSKWINFWGWIWPLINQIINGWKIKKKRFFWLLIFFSFDQSISRLIDWFIHPYNGVDSISCIVYEFR